MFLRDFPIGKCQNTQSFHGKALILLLDLYLICLCYFANTIMCPNLFCKFQKPVNSAFYNHSIFTVDSVEC